MGMEGDKNKNKGESHRGELEEEGTKRAVPAH